MPRPKLVPIQSVEPQFKIDRGVPIPPKIVGLDGRKYPFEQMEVGDSLFFPGWNHAKASSALSRAATLFGHKYTARKVDGGVRIWRTA